MPQLGRRTVFSVRLYFFHDPHKFVSGIEPLIPQNGPICIARKITVHACLASARTFYRIEFWLFEVHVSTLSP
jgi:hypothetical protein